jgi:hypothetical protein
MNQRLSFHLPHIGFPSTFAILGMAFGYFALPLAASTRVGPDHQ